MDSALTRFGAVFRIDPALIMEYYARKRNVLFSVMQASYQPNLPVCVFVESLLTKDGIHVDSSTSAAVRAMSPRTSCDGSSSVDSNYPMLASEYNLIRPIRDKEGYSDSTGTLWEAVCLSTKEPVAIKVVDHSVWKHMGKMPQQIIKVVGIGIVVVVIDDFPAETTKGENGQDCAFSASIRRQQLLYVVCDASVSTQRIRVHTSISRVRRNLKTAKTD
jgi:hypothetical protein